MKSEDPSGSDGGVSEISSISTMVARNEALSSLPTYFHLASSQYFWLS